MIKVKAIWVMALLTTLITTGMAWAGDHERARILLEQGEILSLSEIMEKASLRVAGKVLEIELEEEDGLIVYKIEFLDANNVIMEMLIDARTGVLVSVEED